MIDWRATVVERARAVIGVPFRFQGRDTSVGLDCVGLVVHAFDIPASAVKRNYTLWNHSMDEMDSELRRFFTRSDQRAPGVILLCSLRGHAHLAIECGASFIHSDARLRRVVETPGAPAWPVVAAYRPMIPDLQAS